MKLLGGDAASAHDLAPSACEGHLGLRHPQKDGDLRDLGFWGRDSGIALDSGSNLGSGFWNPDFGFPMFCGVRALGFKPQRAHGRDFKAP